MKRSFAAVAILLFIIFGRSVKAGVFDSILHVYRNEAKSAAFQGAARTSDYGLYNPRDFGAIGDGNADDTAAFASMLKAIGTTQATVLIPRTTGQFVLRNLTIPPNVTLDFPSSGGIRVATGQKVTILGRIISPPQQIFYNCRTTIGEGEVSFGNNSSFDGRSNIDSPKFRSPQVEYWVEWFGAMGDDTTDDADALNAAFSALPDGMIMRMAGRFYIIKHTVTFQYKTQTTLEGNRGYTAVADNLTMPILVYTGEDGGVALKINNCEGCTFRGFGVYSNNGANPSKGADIGVLITFDAKPQGYPLISSHNIFEGIFQRPISNRPKWIAFDISNPGGNNEQHTFRDCVINGTSGVGSTNQTGVRMGHNQVKAIIFDRNTFSSLGTGIDGQGNFRAYNNIWSNVNVMYADHDLVETNLVEGDDTENVQFVWLAFPGTPGSQTSFINCRWQAITAAGTSPNTAPMQFAGGNYSISNSNFTHIKGYFGPYFVGTVNEASPAVVFHDSSWFANSVQSLAPGFALANTLVTNGRLTYSYGPAAKFDSGQLLQGATPGFTSARPIISMPGPASTPFNDQIYFGSGSLAIDGLHPPAPFSVAAFGSAGTTVRRLAALIAVDAAGRRTTRSVQPNGDQFVIYNWNSKLDDNNYIHFSWPAQSPAPDHFELWDLNNKDSDQWRLIAKIRPSGGPTESYDLKSEPTGTYARLDFYRNEAETLVFRNTVLYPIEATLPDNSATPSVAIGNDFVTHNTERIVITNLVNGTSGQEIRIRAGDDNTTIQNNSNIVTGTGKDIKLSNGAIYVFIYRGKAWHAVASP